MSHTISIPASSGVGQIRIRDRRRVRRSPAGAIVPNGNAHDWQTYRAPRAATLRPSEDIRQFVMSFTAFFTAAMIFLA